MKPETTRGARRLVPRRRRSRGRSDAVALHGGDPGLDTRGGGDPADFDPAEFAEFLAADDALIEPDPAFRERLRQELWGMVRSQAERKRSALQAVPTQPDKRRR